jgi:transposase
MPTGKPRNPANERFWRETLTHWQRSGLSVADYCRRYRMSAARFYAWRRELARRDDTTTRAAATAATFLPVQVLADRTPAIEIVLANDRVVRVPAGFDERTLRHVLALAEDASC